MLKRIPIFWKLSFVYITIVLLTLALVIYINNLIANKNLQILLSVIVVIIICGGFTWLFEKLFIKKHIRELVNGMSKLAEKEFDFRLDENEDDEFGSLASSFNDMASMLSSFLTELKKTRDYVQSILESSADIIITVNPSGKIQTINMGAENALGYQRFEVIGKPMEMLFANPQDRQVALDKLKHSDNLINYETKFLTKNDKIRDVLLTLSRLRNPTGEIIGTIGISKDITREKRLQNQLIQSQRLAAIGEVFTGIQHSMKNMLNACKGGSYMVKTGLAKDNRKMLEEGWEIVQEGIAKMTEMSINMLKYVKEWKPKLKTSDLTITLTEIYRVIKQTAADKGVELRLNISSELPSILCDTGMIYSALMDIVSNALDACLWKDYADNETPAVTISAYTVHNDQELVIEIKDNGCGMSDDVKENIFTPFFSTKSKAGTGLGLSITSRMINAHNGKINVESELNRGTVFHIVLPINKNNQNEEINNGEKGSSS